jgi:hypothetical protein
LHSAFALPSTTPACSCWCHYGMVLPAAELESVLGPAGCDSSIDSETASCSSSPAGGLVPLSPFKSFPSLQVNPLPCLLPSQSPSHSHSPPLPSSHPLSHCHCLTFHIHTVPTLLPFTPSSHCYPIFLQVCYACLLASLSSMLASQHKTTTRVYSIKSF